MIIVDDELGFRVKVRTPDAPLTAVPVAVVEITKTVELGTRAILTNVRLNAAVDNPVIVKFRVVVARV